MYRIICIILSAFIALLSLTGIKIQPDETGNNVCASYSSYNDEKSEIIENFDFQKVNTVEINFDKSVELTVTVEANGTVIYERTGSEAYRFCAFSTVETDNLKISVSPSSYIKDITVSYKTSSVSNFRVTAYAVASTLLDKAKLSSNSFDVITDVILFGAVTFDENGKLNIQTDLLETSLKNLRDVIADRSVNVYLNILGPDADSDISDWNKQMRSKAEKHSKAFLNPSLITDINAVLEKYDFDGIFFDYEFPLNQIYWDNFNFFLQRLDLSTDKKIGIAVADWNLMLNLTGIHSVDMIELMQYDLFDDDGNHSSFDVCPDGIDDIRKMFIPAQKVDMGVPFYARPTDKSAVWLNYNEYADELGRTRDHTDTEYGEVYFNSYQTIYDKTAYSISRGLGGMMVWHYACDITDTENELSLFGAMRDCIADRIHL